MKRQKAGSLLQRLGWKEGEFPALEERAGCSRAVFLLIPFKGPSGRCCCLAEQGSVRILPLLRLCPLVAQSGNLASPHPLCFVSSKLPNKLTRINVSDLDKDGFFKTRSKNGQCMAPLTLSPRCLQVPAVLALVSARTSVPCLPTRWGRQWR